MKNLRLLCQTTSFLSHQLCTSLIFFFFISVCTAHAEGSDRIKIDASVLASIPAKRHAALAIFAITDRDSTPAIGEKKTKYIEALKSIMQELLAAYYWHGELPNGIDEAIEKRAVYQAGLQYPGSPTTGASFYGDLVQNYKIRMYEEDIVTIAYAVSERFSDRDIVIVRGKAQAFTTWKKAWDEAGEVKGGPNQQLSEANWISSPNR